MVAQVNAVAAGELSRPQDLSVIAAVFRRVARDHQVRLGPTAWPLPRECGRRPERILLHTVPARQRTGSSFREAEPFAGN